MSPLRPGTAKRLGLLCPDRAEVCYSRAPRRWTVGITDQSWADRWGMPFDDVLPWERLR